MTLFSVIVLFPLLDMKKSSILIYRKAVNILVTPLVMLLSTAHSYNEHTDPAQTLAFQPSPKCQPSQTPLSFQNQMWSGM